MFSTKVKYRDIEIPKCNFGFIYDVTNNEDLYTYCFHAEANIYTDQNSCMDYLRKAFEHLAEYIYIRNKHPKDYKERYEEYQKYYVDHRYGPEPNTPAPKSILKKQFTRKPLCFTDISNKCGENSENHDFSDDNCTSIEDMYHILCEGVHGSDKPNAEKCSKQVETFFYMSRALFKALYGFNNVVVYSSQRHPIGNYIHIPNNIRKRLNLSSPNSNNQILPSLYITEEQDENRLFLLKKVEGKNAVNKRDIESPMKLWRYSISSPDNILEIRETIGKAPYCWRVFEISGEAMAFTKKNIEKLSKKEKDEVTNGLIRCIQSLHSSNPPMPHRGFDPDDFILVKTEIGIMKPILVSFETTKYLFQNSNETTYDAVIKSHDLYMQFIPIEAIRDTVDLSILKSADIYSLGKLILFIYSNGSDLKHCLSADCPMTLQAILPDMINNNWEKRPDIKTISEILKLNVKDTARFSVVTEKGTRKEQQDSCLIYSPNKIREKIPFIMADQYKAGYKDEAFPVLLAVFDGMGGEYRGGELAKLLSQETARYEDRLTKPDVTYKGETDPARKLLSFADYLEQIVSDYLDAHPSSSAGCTGVISLILENKVVVMNVGDSEAFLIRNGELKKLTTDDVFLNGILHEGQLSQYFGVSVDGYDIDPHIVCEDLKEHDIVLLATDGLNPVIKEDGFLNLVQNEDSEVISNKISERIVASKKSDNTTMILYRRE